MFWKDKPVVIQQLRKWNMKELSNVAIKIGETEILMKKTSYLRNDIVIKDLITVLTDQASTTYS